MERHQNSNEHSKEVIFNESENHNVDSKAIEQYESQQNKQYKNENIKVEKSPSQNVYSGEMKSMKGFRSYKNSKPQNYQSDDLEQHQSYGAEKNPGWTAKPKKLYGTSPGHNHEFPISKNITKKKFTLKI